MTSHTPQTEFPFPTTCTHGSVQMTEQTNDTRCPAHRLPSTVLMDIYKLIYIEARKGITWQDRELEVAELARRSTWNDDSIHSPVLFPFALASVCKKWKDLLMTEPEFWKRCVVYIDRPRTPLLTLKLFIKASRHLLLDVYVVRNVHDKGAVDSTEERSIIDSMMALLAPHSKRCRALNIETKYSSSLPTLLSLTVDNGYTSLNTLHLKCQVEDRIHKPILPNTPVHLNPAITFLSLDGFNFCILSRLPVALKPRFIRLQRISISNYHPENHLHPLTFHEFMSTLIHLQPFYLSLDDVQLTYQTLKNPKLSYTVDINELRFTNIPSPLIAHFFQSVIIYPEGITIGRSSIKAPIPCNFLSLCDLSDDEDLCLVLKDWSGGQLTIDNCPSFNDDVLQLLASKHRSRGSMMLCSDLVIKDCTNFTPTALKNLIQSSIGNASTNLGGSELAIFEGLERASIQNLEGKGKVPKLDPQLRSWFKANLVEFKWEGEDFN